MDADICFHVGVLYHLADPVRHLRSLLPLVRRAILLDTHIAYADECDREDRDDGYAYRYKVAGEFGRSDPFSGMSTHSRWLQLSTIRELLSGDNLSILQIEERVERNGPRVLLIAERVDPASTSTGEIES
jgi:tRNA (mo5U34)-methyltransferase